MEDGDGFGTLQSLDLNSYEALMPGEGRQGKKTPSGWDVEVFGNLPNDGLEQFDHARDFDDAGGNDGQYVEQVALEKGEVTFTGEEFETDPQKALERFELDAKFNFGGREDFHEDDEEEEEEKADEFRPHFTNRQLWIMFGARSEPFSKKQMVERWPAMASPSPANKRRRNFFLNRIGKGAETEEPEERPEVSLQLKKDEENLLSAEVGQVRFLRIPVRNDNETLWQYLRVKVSMRDPANQVELDEEVSISPQDLEIPPGDIAEISVRFAPRVLRHQKIPIHIVLSDDQDRKCFIMVGLMCQPKRMWLRPDRPVINFGGTHVAQLKCTKLRLTNVIDEAIDFDTVVDVPKDPQAEDGDENLDDEEILSSERMLHAFCIVNGKERRTLQPGEFVEMELEFLPQRIAQYQASFVVKAYKADGSRALNLFRIPIRGYGGKSNVSSTKSSVLMDQNHLFNSCEYKRNITVANEGSRTAYIQARPASDAHTLIRVSPSSMKLLAPGERQDYTIFCHKVALPIDPTKTTVEIAHGDEILRRRRTQAKYARGARDLSKSVSRLDELDDLSVIQPQKPRANPEDFFDEAIFEKENAIIPISISIIAPEVPQRKKAKLTNQVPNLAEKVFVDRTNLPQVVHFGNPSKREIALEACSTEDVRVTLSSRVVSPGAAVQLHVSMIEGARKATFGLRNFEDKREILRLFDVRRKRVTFENESVEFHETVNAKQEGRLWVQLMNQERTEVRLRIVSSSDVFKIHRKHQVFAMSGRTKVNLPIFFKPRHEGTRYTGTVAVIDCDTDKQIAVLYLNACSK